MVALNFRLSAGAFAAILGPGCASAPHAEIPTIDLVELIGNIESLRGQTVRTCGEGVLQNGPVWELVRPIGRHGARLLINPCEGRPVRDAEGCIAGRIARRDGSLELNQAVDDTSIAVAADNLANYGWFLHEQCRHDGTASIGRLF